MNNSSQEFYEYARNRSPLNINQKSAPSKEKEKLQVEKQDFHIGDVIRSIGKHVSDHHFERDIQNLVPNYPKYNLGNYSKVRPDWDKPNPVDPYELSMKAVSSWKLEREVLSTALFKKIELDAQKKLDHERRLKLQIKHRCQMYKKDQDLDSTRFLGKLQGKLENELGQISQENFQEFPDQHYKKGFDYMRPMQFIPLKNIVEKIDLNKEVKQTYIRLQTKPDLEEQYCKQDH